MSDVEQVDVETVSNWLGIGHAVIIDVREDHEYQAGHVANSHHIAMSRFDPQMIPTLNESQRLVFMCAVGQRSQTVAQHLLSQGFIESACNLMGGIHAWDAAGLSITT